MERFKTILRNSVTNGDFKINLTVGHAPRTSNGRGESNMQDFGAIELRWLQSIYNFLFQRDITRINQGSLTKGVLNVPNLGRVLLIAQKSSEPFLNLYLPPEGEIRYQKDLAALELLATDEATTETLAKKLASRTDQMSSPDTSGHRPTPWEESSSSAVKSPLKEPSPAVSVKASQIPVDSLFGPMADEIADGDAPIEVSSADDNIPLQMADESTDSFAFIPSPASSLSKNATANLRLTASYIDDEESTEPGSHNSALNQDIAISSLNQPSSGSWTATDSLSAAPVGREASNTADSNISFTNPGGASISAGNNAIDAILREMIQRRASDVHLVIGQPVIFRIDGSIARMSSSALTAEKMQKLLLPIIPQRNHDEFASSSDSDFAYQITDVGRFRVNLFRDSYGVGAVMRHIPANILTAEQLNLPPVITALSKLSKGLVLITGPTGSGKSTTLAAVIDTINKTRSDHLLTIEDPIEFVHPQQQCLVNQREVGIHTSSFARALKAALREDPDIIMIGEMRDLETIHIALETAETGHLVFGTLHTTTAVSTITRIIDQFPSDQQEQVRQMLAASLKAVVTQTLLKKKGGGRVAAHEILITSDAIANMIREGKDHMIASHMQTQKADGNILLNESLANLVSAGTVELEEAWNKAVDKKGFVEMIKRKGIPLTMSDGTTVKAAS